MRHPFVHLRRRLITGAALSAATPWLQAQPASYPDHPVRVVVPFPPGGITDAVGRLINSKLEERWKVSVMLDQRPGAGGALAAAQLRAAPPDGYTLLMASNSMLLAPLLDPTVQFDLVRDFMPVSLVGLSPLVLLVSKQMGVNSIAEFGVAMKANPDKYNYGTIGAGSSLHLMGEQLARRMNAKPVAVPQKGGAPIVNEMVAGRLDFSFMDQMTGRAFVDNGTLKAIAVAGPARAPLYANAPTFAESGIAGLEVSSWYGFFVAKGTPPALVQRISADLVAVLRQPDVMAKLAQTGTEVRASTPEEFSQLIASDVQAWSRMVRETQVGK